MRLAEENRWTPEYALRAIEEYKRFVFLAMVCPHEVTPSKTVDVVWHLHLLYTENYWQKFCHGVLGRDFHHFPGDGSVLDEARFQQNYAETLASYRSIFQLDPPEDIWGLGKPKNLKARTTTTTRSRMNVPAPPEKIPLWAEPAPWIVGELLFAAIMTAAWGGDVMNLPGPDFLSYFFKFYLFSIFIAGFSRLALATHDRDAAPLDEPLDPYTLAYLVGGRSRVAATLAGSLLSKGVIARIGVSCTATGVSLEDDAPMIERQAMSQSLLGGSLFFNSMARKYENDFKEKLARHGLWMSAKQVLKARLTALSIVAIPVAVGLAKIQVGISRGRPVELLEFFLLFFGLGALFVILGGGKRTHFGGHYVRSLIPQRSIARGAALADPNATEDFLFALAMYGSTAALGLPYYSDLRAMTLMTSTGAGSCSSGSSCSGGSSCGGGGGCGGGGCGGCSS